MEPLSNYSKEIERLILRSDIRMMKKRGFPKRDICKFIDYQATLLVRDIPADYVGETGSYAKRKRIPAKAESLSLNAGCDYFGN